MDASSVGHNPVFIETLFSPPSEQKNESSSKFSEKIGGIFSFLSRKSRDKGGMKLENKATDMTDLSSTDAQRESQLTIAWASDIHFDHAKEKGVENFLAEVKKQNPSLLLLAGAEYGSPSPHFSHSLGKVLRSVFRGCKKERSDIVLETRPTRLFYKTEEQSVEIFRKVCEKCGLAHSSQ